MAPDAREIYVRRGMGQRQAMGTRPCLLIIDFNNGFTDPASPLHCDADEAVAATARVLQAARDAQVPVAYTTIEYDEPGKRIAKSFIEKVPSLLTLAPGTRWPLIDERIAPRPGEPVFVKLFASAFFGTGLASMLTAERCDSVIVTGASTSGCVRATVVDALQHGYPVLVPRDAVADRAPAAHEASLTDIDAKYGDVVSAEFVVERLERTRPSEGE
jgi:maleamate amidohydrolase